VPYEVNILAAEGKTDEARVLSFACVVVFDLDAAPNFKARIGESGLSWPPATLVHYPAKNW